jgi:hypothetical protein
MPVAASASIRLPTDGCADEVGLQLVCTLCAWRLWGDHSHRAEVGGAIVLLSAAAIALIWANEPWVSCYDTVQPTVRCDRLGDTELALDLRHWVNDGLMAFVFFVMGLELRRQLD